VAGYEHGPADELLERIGAIGLELSDADGLQLTLQRIVDLGQELLEHCDGASLMLIGRGGRIETPAYSTSQAHASDLAQYATGEGPCLEAIAEQGTIVIDDLETEERWPAYRREALAIGVRSMLSLRLFVTEDSLGALDLYSRRPHAFDRRSRLVGQVFAAQASVAMKAALVEAGLEATIRSRDVIGQAKGIVMARRRLTPALAFDLLKRVSQERNQRLVDVAEEVARTGEVPRSPDGPATRG
jgi:transcriptional regulator with GAF, ATPase, and Fis domain